MAAELTVPLAPAEPAAKGEADTRATRRPSPPVQQQSETRRARRGGANDSSSVTTGNKWSGMQIGGSNGSSLANNNFVEPGSYICPPTSTRGRNCFETPFGFKEQPGSPAFGTFVGYRLQIGMLVVGVEGDVAYKHAASTVSISPETPIHSSERRFLRHDAFTGAMSQGSEGSARARVGVLVTPSILIYGTAGVAMERVTGSLSYTGTVYDCGESPTSCRRAYIGAATSGTSFSETRRGATGGGGVEMQLIGPWTARLEYRFSDFGSFTKAFPVQTHCGNYNCSSPSQSATIDLHPTLHTVQFGLGLSF